MTLREPPPLGTAMLPRDTFTGQAVLVTGGGTGLGKAIACEFARTGANVAIASRGVEHRARGVAAIERLGTKTLGVAVDVREPESIAAAFDAAEGALGPITILVNNAAGNFPVASEELSPRGWRSVTQIVLDGTFFCSSELARRLIARERGGAILNIGATYSWTGGPGTAASAAAKAGVTNLTQSLAVEWAPDDIRVNCLAPGAFPHEDMPEHMRGGRPADEAARARTIPGGRVGRLHELGWLATYICSPYAAYLTGETIVLDGANWLRRNLRMPEFEPVRETLPRRAR